MNVIDALKTKTKIAGERLCPTCGGEKLPSETQCLVCDIKAKEKARKEYLELQEDEI